MDEWTRRRERKKKLTNHYEVDIEIFSQNDKISVPDSNAHYETRLI